MDLERRRLLLALASTTAYLVAQILSEIAFGAGLVSTHVITGEPMWRVIATLVPLLLIAVILRDLQRRRSDWPVERVVIVLSALLVVDMLWAAIALGFPAQAFVIVIWLTHAAAAICGLAILLRGSDA